MNSQNYNVKLNMKDSGVVESGIRMKQGDSLMRLVFTIYEGGSIYFNANDVPKVYFRRPDGTTVFGTAESSTDNYIYVIKGNELQLAGTVLCDVKFTLENGRESSCTFKMEVVPDTISANTGGSGIYDNDLAEIVEEIEDLKDEVEEIATESSENATLAKSYAVGGTGTRAGEDTDNAKYYMEQSKTITGIGKGNLTIKQGGTVAGTFNANSLTDVEIDLTSGTTVSVDQITSTGTHIADITVDGTKTELYAPNNGGGTWGSITGTLSNQTDLNTALGGKQDKLTAGTNILIDSNNVISVTGGGSGGLLPEVYITSESDATVTVTNGTVTLTPTKKSSTTWYTTVPSFGDWTIHSVNSLGDVEYTLAVDTVKIYQVAVNHFTAYIKVNYTTGATVTLTNNGQSVSVTSSGQKVAVHSSGNWLATASFDAQTSQSKTVVISTEGQEETVTLDGFATLNVNYDAVYVGETVTLTNGTKTYTKSATSSLSVQFVVDVFGTWSATTSKTSQSVDMPTKGTYSLILSEGDRHIIVTYESAFEGAEITCTNGSVTKSQTASGGTIGFYFDQDGTFTISSEASGTTYTSSVVVNGAGDYNVDLLTTPDGSTVTPTDNVQTWLKCADITNKSYTTIAEVLADSTTLNALIQNNNASDYMARSTNWSSSVVANSNAMIYIGNNNYCSNKLLSDTTWSTAICNSTYFEKVLTTKTPTMTSNTTPSGEVIGVAQSNCPQANLYKGFNADITSTDQIYFDLGTSKAYVTYKFTQKILMKYISIVRSNTESGRDINAFKIQGSNDGSTFTDIKTISDTTQTKKTFAIPDNMTKYQYYKLVPTAPTSGLGRLSQLIYYGRA